jgi:small conductance mechanosensitive channel
MVGRVNSPVPNPTGLPPFVENNKDWLIVIPIRIAITIIVAVIVRWVLHRLVDRLVRPVRGGVPRILRPFKERIESSRLIESTGLLSERRGQRAQTIGSVIKSIISIIILSIAIMVILSELQVDLAPFIAGTSIVGVALGFGAQNIVKDFLSGLFMLFEDQYGVGDVIDADIAAPEATPEAQGRRAQHRICRCRNPAGRDA